MNPIITYMALHELNNSLREIYHNESYNLSSNSSCGNIEYKIEARNLEELSDNNNLEAEIFQSSTITKQNLRSLI